MRLRFYINFMQNLFLFVFTVLLLCVFPTESFAYLDHGTGSYILQMIMAGLLGGLFAIKMFWNTIKERTRNLFRRKKKDESY